MTTENNNPSPVNPIHNQPPLLPEASRKKGLGKGGKIVIGITAALMLAVAVFLIVPSQNADACKLYESADQELDDAITMHKEGIISQSEVRATFRDLPSNIGIAASEAHGDVRVEMQKSLSYASAYQSSQTKDNGVAYFMHQNRVADACSAERSPIDLED